ncbi:MAG TPA: glycoside hydrolase family 25 protein [Polyangiaceae bacterium]
MTYGIDLSHHQRASSVPWATIAQTATFCICRTSYGAELRDCEIANHIHEARLSGLTVGVYHFFRPHHDAAKQFELFRSVVSSVNACLPGDIVPFVDIEADPVPAPGVAVAPSWSDPARELVERISAEYNGCGVYITAREFGFLGSPAWVLERPLWVAHYRNGSPATPAGRAAHIHQHRVGPYAPDGPGGVFGGGLVLDQNRALLPLPLIPSLAPPNAIEPDAPTPRFPWIGPPELGLPSDAYDEMSEGRRKHNLEEK